MNKWEIVVIVLIAGNVGMSLAKHGESKTEKWSFPMTLIAEAIVAFILYKAGLWH